MELREDLMKLSKDTKVKHDVVIKDSGQRTEFNTGAVRDMSEGKGRCDLMPLDIISMLFTKKDMLKGGYYVGKILCDIDTFKLTKDVDKLYNTIFTFWNMKQTDAINNGDVFDPYEFILGLALHYEQGAKKYGENNWQKGIPVSSCIDSAVRHLLKHVAGYADEPHDRAFVWNIVTALYMLKNKPDMDDYSIRE